MERDMAMATDASTPPGRRVSVGSPEEANACSSPHYQKAPASCACSRDISDPTLRAGIRRYLESHATANTETADLWDAIEAASGEPVRDIMNSWILQGLPLVTAVVDADGPPR